MKNFYISSMQGYSGICKYSADFYELVLKDKGYIFIDSKKDLSEIFTTISSRDHVHIEIGLFQKKETEILFLMIKAGYKSIAITLHDPPLLQYPFRLFKHPLLNKASKFYDRFIVKFTNTLPYIKKIETVYVLSLKGAAIAKSIYKTNNIFYLPHVICTNNYNELPPLNKNFIYFGFIGKNKGIEYALRLHQKLLKFYPDVLFYVVGDAIGREKKYYSYLKSNYHQNVHYMGYVAEAALGSLYSKATFALSLFKDYQFFYPMSGSVLNNLRMDKILLTTKVNSIPEIITDKVNGFYLSYNLEDDIKLILELYKNPDLLKVIIKNQQEYLKTNHSPMVVQKYLKEHRPENIPAFANLLS